MAAAPMAAAFFWLVLAASIAFNPGYNPLERQLSVLGTGDVENPWIYNAGIAATGLLTAVYGAAVALDPRWRKEGLLITLGSASLTVAALLPGYSDPHVIATRLFFLLVDVAFIEEGVKWMRLGERLGGAAMLLTALIAPALWLAVKAAHMWPGALGELYGAAVVDALLLADWRLRTRGGKG